MPCAAAEQKLLAAAAKRPPSCGPSHQNGASLAGPLQVLGADYQAELLQLIAPEHLMQCYGGSNATPMR